MKKEIVRIHNLSATYHNAKLVGISFALMASECVGFLGLIDSGKNLMVDILYNKLNFNQMCFYNGKYPISIEEVHQMVYRINSSNYIIDNWTVAEYLCLDSIDFKLGIYKKKKLANLAQQHLQKLGLAIDVNQNLGELSELDKRLVDLAKAYSRGKKILLIEDEFEGCSTQDIRRFKEVLDLVIKHQMAVIINSHSDSVSYILSDTYIIFKKGYIIKKCSKNDIRDNHHLEKFLLSRTIISQKKDLDNYQIRQSPSRQIVYSVRNLRLNNKDHLGFDFHKSEVVTILTLNVNEKRQIFELLSGRCIDKLMQIYLEQKPCSFTDITDFVNNKIVSIVNMGGGEELLLNMSVGDNLLMPSLHKISSLQYVFWEHNMIKMIEREAKNKAIQIGHHVRDMGINEHIVLLLERWYIYRPKVLVLFEPFIHCDIYGISLVKSYIKKISSLGTTVVIIKSTKEYIQDISDRIIPIL